MAAPHEASLPPQRALAQAWDCFAAGDLPGARQAALHAREADPADPAAAAALGFFLLEGGDLGAAAQVLLPACEAWPACAPLHWYTGYLHQRQGSLRQAAQALRKACVLDARLDEAAFALGWVLHDLGEMKEAAVWAELALRARRSPERLLQAGWLRQLAGQWDSAAGAFREALEQADSQSEVAARLWMHLAQCLRASGDEPAADRVLQQGLAAQPGQPDLLLECGWQARGRGDTGAAMHLARELVDRAPERAAGWYLLGLLREEQGDLGEADEAYAQAHTREPRHVQALLRRARLQRGRQCFEGAGWLVELALRADPGDAEAADLHAQLLLDEGQPAAARRALLPRLRQDPMAADRWRLLAAAHLQGGRSLAARRALARALKVAPANVEALRMQGWLLLELGDTQGATAAVRELLSQRQEDVMAQLQAAFIHAHAGLLRDAQVWAERAVARDPKEAEAWRALAQVHYRQGRLDDAACAIRESLRLAPGRRDSLRQLGWVRMAGGQFGLAQLAFLRALEAAPGDRVVALELAQARRRAGEFASARADADVLLATHPDWAPVLLLKAQLRVDEGDVGGFAEAVRCAQQLLRAGELRGEATRVLIELEASGHAPAAAALALQPPGLLAQAWREAVQEAVHLRGHAVLQGLLDAGRRRFPEDTWLQAAALFALAGDPATDAQALGLAAREWYRALKIRAGLSPFGWGERRGRARRRPRLAYVASQLHQPLLRRVLAAHDPQRVDVCLFTPHAIAGLPAHVRQEPLVPEHLADACAAQAVDLVVDAGGLHPFEGQDGVLHAFARRLAPLQAGWLGTLGTSGGLFDLLLADEVAVPPGHAHHYEEEVVRLEGGQWCWEPPPEAPAIGELPGGRAGAVTFGVVARSLRLADASVEAFAQVLAQVPGATLRFIGRSADDHRLRQRVLATFLRHGVASHRIEFDPFRPRHDYLAWFSGIDIVLDTCPASGGLSLLEPLWMGVPVVTLAGGWAGARQGASVLAALGLHDCIATDLPGYVRAASALAADLPALAALRQGLRARMQGSPLLDGRRLAAQIEALCERGLADPDTPEPLDAKAQVRRQADRALDAWLQVPRSIDLPETEAPLLSVVIVLFNQAGLSRRMLQALADQRGVRFETIVVDNGSSDRTPELLQCLRGARIVRNTGNLGFLRAANQAAALARAPHLVFLNSDAFLQPGALAAALDALQSDASVGVVGGRIVLSAGGLQEAGNAIFRDGLAGGVGRGEDPWSHGARVARGTDYVSGVLMATRRSVWQALGGFDEAYAPAYYEDADYCLRVWQAGLRCVVEPRVLVEHLEWGSAAGDSATALMQRNRALFVRRHEAWLQAQPRAGALPLDRDAWRSPEDRPRRRPRVLMLDNEVPHDFKGAGLPRARRMLQALAGWPVTFYPLWVTEDNWEAVHASMPPTVEVALGHGLAGLEAFLERRRGVYDVLLVSRPPNLAAIAPLRERRPELFAGLRLVYDAEAVFALREIAQAGVQGRPFRLGEARAHVAAEVALARGAQDVLVVSGRDRACFERAGLRTHVLAHPVRARVEAPALAGRSGLLFIGALLPGTPNEDGLLWFVREVLPRLRQRVADVPPLTVVGLCESRELARLDGGPVRLLGKQDRLEPFYDAARVFIAPARFAGGVPLKVIEAAAQGVPVVASALLVRQLGWHPGIDIQGARDAEAFAGHVARLLEDDALWLRQRSAAWSVCGRQYDPERFAATLRAVIAPGQ